MLYIELTIFKFFFDANKYRYKHDHEMNFLIVVYDHFFTYLHILLKHGS